MLILSKVALLASMLLAVLFSLNAVLAPCAIGRATAIDGDSLMIGTVRVDLFGIDALELNQTCQSATRTWACGQQAAAALHVAVDDHWLLCRIRTTESGAASAICFRGLRDVAGMMVSQGWALAQTSRSHRYYYEEATSRATLQGIWSARFEPPAVFRQRRSVIADASNRHEASTRAARATQHRQH